ncbi:MAG: hypothetical protein HY922_08735 [Elusimicrobia bacterium]|nr:hypothetical protein [Elusimicrobiota bacterium]
MLKTIPLLILAAAAHAQTPPLQVMSVAPLGQIQSQDAAKAVTVVFNQPMTPLTAAEEAGAFCPIEFKPRIRGRCRWQGTNVLSFEPQSPLPAASSFNALIPAGTKSTVSGAVLEAGRSWSFQTMRPALEDSRPRHDEHWISLDALIFLHFNLPMEPKKAQPYISLVQTPLYGYGEEAVPVGVRRATPEEVRSVWKHDDEDAQSPSTSTVLVLKPSMALRKDHAYRLTLKEGLKAAEGELGLISDRIISFEAYYTFRLLDTSMHPCLPAVPTLLLSNPVHYEDLLAHMTITPPLNLPAPEGWKKQWAGHRDSGSRRVSFDLSGGDIKPDTQYEIRISPDLNDVFGNPLGQEASASFYAGGYCPRFSMAESFGVMESYLPALHPLTAVNVEQVPMQMAHIPPESLIAFFNSLDWGSRQPQSLPMTYLSKVWQTNVARTKKARLGVSLGDALGGKSSGFVFLQAQGPDYEWHKALVNVTNFAVTVKSSPDSTLVWATFLRTGAPVKGAKIELRGEDGRLLRAGATDPSGIYSGPGWKGLGIKEWKRWQRPKLWVFASIGNEFAALTTAWRGALAPWRFNVSYDDHPRPFRHEGIVFTERGVYRPGETVYAKGILRELISGDWEPTSLKTVAAVIKDPRSAEVFRSTLPVSASSAFDFAVPIKANAPTGVYEMSVSDDFQASAAAVQAVSEEGGEREEGGEEEAPAPSAERKLSLEGSFRVEAYKPAVFEVKVRSSKDEYLAGDLFEAFIDGWYLFGAPMAQAPFDAKLRLEPGSFQPPGFEGFAFGPGWWEETSRYEGRLLAASTGTLDSQGKTAFKAILDPGSAERPLMAALEASVMSPERQRLSGRASAVAHRANLYLGIRAKKTFIDKGQDYSAEIVAVRPDGTPAEGLTVEGKLMRRDWFSVQKAGLGGRLEWVSERRDVEAATFSFTASKTTFTWTHSVDQVGLHTLRLSAADEQGRLTRAGDSFYAVGKGEAWWERSDTDIVELVPDKKSYKPGDTARILVKSPYAQTRALVSVERERILERRTVQLEGGAGFIEVALKPDHVPNVYVGVVLMQGRSGMDKFSAEGDDIAKPQAKFGYAALSVDPGGRRLSVALKTDAAEYRPRGRVAASLAVTDEKGRGVSAEAAVFAVDEGVLALTGYGTPDVFRAFYGPRPLLVETASLLQYVIGQRSFGEKGQDRGGGGGAAGLSGIDLRSLFVPTAYWNPSVRTDKEGRANLDFTLPDNLSRFRLMAVAQAGRLMGSGETRLSVKKPLMLRPSLPRFARLGDVFQGGIVVHNYTGSSAAVKVELKLRGEAAAYDGPPERTIEVESGKALEVLWPMKASALGQAAFEFRCAAGSETDGLEWKLETSLPTPLEYAATSGATAEKAEEKITVPKTSRPDLGGLEASLSPTAMAGLQEGAKFLLGYPYGCLEQKLSRAFPVLVGADMVETYGLGDLKGLKRRSQEVFKGLSEFQHPSGGFGYWPAPINPDPYLTAYALHAAAIAKKEGYEVEAGVLSKAVSWLRGYLYGERSQWAYPYSRSEDYASRAYALYALALHGQKESGYLSNLFMRRDRLPVSGKAHLLKAAKALEAEPLILDTLASELLQAARYSPTTLHFESSEDAPWTHESNVRTTALVLQAMLEARGGFPADDKAVRWLMEERKNLGRWRTTQENFAALYALQDYYRAYEKESPSFQALAKLAGQEWKETFQGRTLEARLRSFPLSALEEDKGRVSLSKEGTGRLYYTLRLSWMPKEERARSEGLSIEKKIEPLAPGAGSKAFPPGSRAVVTLKVKTPQDRTFVAINDPVPAGFEIVDPTFAVEGQESARILEERAKDNPYWGTFQRSENYDDRIQIFADYLTAGEHSYSYLVQAATPGAYRMPSTRVEQMYQPEVFGATAGGEVVVGR